MLAIVLVLMAATVMQGAVQNSLQEEQKVLLVLQNS